MALVSTSQVIIMAAGVSTTLTITSTTGTAVSAVTNSTYITASVVGSVWTISNTANFPLVAQIVFTSADTVPFAITLPTFVYVPDTTVQTGRSAAQMAATIRNRTNLVFGEPTDAVLVQMMNDGIEEVARRLEPVQTNVTVAVVNPNMNMFILPQNVERVRDANYSTGSPGAPGTIVYELVQLDYDTFIQETDASPAGGIGGIPTIYSLIQDASGLMVCQFYPYTNTGQFNFHVFKRPLMYTTDVNGNASTTSYTDLDALWQGAVILFACSQICENREDYTTADRFLKMYDKTMEENMLEVKRRVRKRGTNTVRDVGVGESVIPTWMR
jgi:hypothetical protein